MIDYATMHNFVSAVLAQAMQATTINTKPIWLTLGNKFMVPSTKLAKLSISFTFRAAQTVWCHIVPEMSALVIFGMDWLTQINPKINWSEITLV